MAATGGNVKQGEYDTFSIRMSFFLRRVFRYQPTNNIYGYNYDSSASPSDAAKLVVNPNYAYLNDALSEGYARNYVQAETQYAQNNQNNGALSFTVDDVA